MIRHLSFFDALGAMTERTPEWMSISAGLCIMRLIDRLAEDAGEPVPSEWSELHTTRMRVEAIGTGDPARAIHLRVLDSLAGSGELSAALGSDLMSYGQVLDLDGRWALAADVFGSVADIFSERDHPEIVIRSSISLGAAARNTGDWQTSERAYARAEHLANTFGSNPLALTAQIGIATSSMVQGNLPQAELELDAIIDEAARECIEPVLALALHARASVAHSRGDYQNAVHFAYRSLELTPAAAARDRILGDIAAAYAGLGMHATARDGYRIVAMTSPHQWVRWQATLNLMELAIDDGDHESFDNYRRELEGAALDPRLKAYFLMLEAVGSREFGADDFLTKFEIARDFAEANRFHQIAFQVDEAMTQPGNPAPALETGSVEPTEELRRIAEVLGHLRKSASV